MVENKEKNLNSLQKYKKFFDKKGKVYKKLNALKEKNDNEITTKELNDLKNHLTKKILLSELVFKLDSKKESKIKELKADISKLIRKKNFLQKYKNTFDKKGKVYKKLNDLEEKSDDEITTKDLKDIKSYLEKKLKKYNKAEKTIFAVKINTIKKLMEEIEEILKDSKKLIGVTKLDEIKTKEKTIEKAKKLLEKENKEKKEELKKLKKELGGINKKEAEAIAKKTNANKSKSLLKRKNEGKTNKEIADLAIEEKERRRKQIEKRNKIIRAIFFPVTILIGVIFKKQRKEYLQEKTAQEKINDIENKVKRINKTISQSADNLKEANEKIKKQKEARKRNMSFVAKFIAKAPFTTAKTAYDAVSFVDNLTKKTLDIFLFY
jgi:DNA repair exonuclease SbcCD ATPase subunit